MRILLSNDDGVYAPGLSAIHQALTESGHDVVVVAPDKERSGSSSAITITQALHVIQLDNGFFAVNGTPADCVYLGCHGFFKEPFDLVVSGINSGANLGDDVLYSGTVGAAREGRAHSLPSLAVSLAGENVRKYTTTQAYKVAANWVADFIATNLPLLPNGHIININVPDVEQLVDKKLAGVKVTRMGRRTSAQPIIHQKDPRGKDMFWIGLAGDAVATHDDLLTDFQAIEKGFVSVTPIQIDATAYAEIELLQQHFV